MALGKSDFVELRLDFLVPAQIPQCLIRVRPHLKRCICTLRPKSEGGRFEGTESERTSILKLIEDFNPHLIDVVYKTLGGGRGLVQYIKRARANILV